MSLRFLLTWLFALLATALRRLRHGPRRRSWLLGFEAWVDAMRRFSRRASKLPYPKQRRAWEAISPPVPPSVERRLITEHEGGDILIPRTAGDRALLWVHGGGFCWGSSATHVELLSHVAILSRATVILPNYRLAPEHKYPAAREDVYRAYLQLLARGAKPGDLVVGGDSAGANLALSLVLLLVLKKQPLPSGLVLMCPWVDLTLKDASLASEDDWIPREGLEALARDYLGSTSPKDTGASPLFADLRGLPPTLIQTGRAERLHDQALALGRALDKAEVSHRVRVYEDMVHNWHQISGVYPKYAEGVLEIARFVSDPSKVVL